MTVDIHGILGHLGKHRPAFHSEADFQHALAWTVRSAYSTAEVRLEVPCPSAGNQVFHVDCRVRFADGPPLFVELKYKTAKLSTTVGGEQYHLKNQSAQDLARYDFIKDIHRLEHLHGATGGRGVAVFLTNDSSFWSQQKKTAPVDAAYRIHQGRDIRGELAWGKMASDGTIKTREQAIQLRGTYRMDWHDYSTVPNGHQVSKFRYCVVEVGSPKGIKKS